MTGWHAGHRLHPIDALVGAWIALVCIVYVTHADMWIAAGEFFGWFTQPTRLFLMASMPLVGIWAVCRLAERSARHAEPGPLEMLVANRFVLLAFIGCSLWALLPGALLPGAVGDDGGTQLMVLPYAVAVFTIGLMIGGAVAVRRHWRRVLGMAWLVAVGTVLFELVRPRTFWSLLPPPHAHWATDPDRPAGVMGDPNTAAFIIVTLTVLLLRYDRLRLRAAALVMVALLAVLATQSRGGLVLAVLAVAGYLYHTRSALRGPALAATLLGGLGLAAGVVFVVLPLLANFAAFSDWEGQRRLLMLTFQGEFVAQDESRLALVTTYFSLIEEAVWLGHGTGFMRTQPIGSHNMYLRQWVDNGAVGLLAYIALLAAGAVLFAARRFPGGQMFLILATVQGFFSHTLLESRGFLLLYALALTASVVEAHRAGASEATPAPGHRPHDAADPRWPASPEPGAESG